MAHWTIQHRCCSWHLLVEERVADFPGGVYLFTMLRSSRSRCSDLGVHDEPKSAPRPTGPGIKHLTALKLVRRVPTVKQYLWGGEFWSDGCPISTVGPHGSEGEIHRYIVQQVLALVAEGKTNKEIAGALELSDKTVKNYLSHVFEKLNVSRRAEAAAFFARRRSQAS